MNRVERERKYWEFASGDPYVRDNYIVDKNIKDSDCLEALCFDPFKYKRTLEVGCGIGRLTTILAKEHPGCTFIGVDISEGMIKQAPELSNVIYKLGKGRSIPEGITDIDFVYSMFVFQHIPEDGVRDYLEDIARVLKPGGCLVFQYVEGVESESFSHHFTCEEVCNWLQRHYDFPYVRKHLLHPSWSWVTVYRKG